VKVERRTAAVGWRLLWSIRNKGRRSRAQRSSRDAAEVLAYAPDFHPHRSGIDIVLVLRCRRVQERFYNALERILVFELQYFR
jgi:hypothetical protein